MVERIYSLLLVDDEEANRMLLSRRLEREGCRVTAAENGARALELLRGGSFDLVLLDMPVVMLTAETSPESVTLCLGRGAADYLAKAVSPEALNQCLHRHLGLNESQEAALVAMARQVTERFSVLQDGGRALGDRLQRVTGGLQGMAGGA